MLGFAPLTLDQRIRTLLALARDTVLPKVAQLLGVELNSSRENLSRLAETRLSELSELKRLQDPRAKDLQGALEQIASALESEGPRFFS